MKCSQCGHENLAHAKFCAKCGAAVTVQATQTTTGQTTETSTGAVSKELRIGVIVGTVFIPLLGIIMGLIFRNAQYPEKKAVHKLWLYVARAAVALGCVCYAITSAAGSAASP